MKKLLLLPFLLSFSNPIFANCPSSVIKNGEISSSGSFCRTSNTRWHSNSSCSCPNAGFKPDLTSKCSAYSMTPDSLGKSALVQKNQDPVYVFEVFTCYEP